ncbi:DctP family TRAP transporter solute-binding subunit [Paenibacillus doosanensis]|uniref:DctP family TRAP transporter solute-binding subunit n=1 Tax=Paenibacillus doosanensis TaxID=1229154 RepID=UPI00217FB51B|nr:DctP family TRAP transporter solute-binding subunit [Paenibacillus doosanensis]MCS7460729.1 DctP family TRAP transporter solute-binding subunit [Paenibacillus doosanensis]
MKSYLGIAAIVILGLMTALIVGFYPTVLQTPVVRDDEQQGLDQQIVIKFSHVVAENTPKGLAAQQFAQLVKEKTHDRVKVEVYPNGVLFSEVDEIRALQQGSVQMIAPSFPNLSDLLPSWMALDLPFAFLSEEAVQEAFDGKIGQTLLDQLQTVDMKGMAFWGNGFKQMTSSKGPIIHPSDLKGQHFRTMRSKLLDAEFRMFDMRTTEMPFNQVYRNYENGTVDGGENSISNIYTKKFYQVQKYMTISNHGYLGYAVLMNRSFWQKLPRDVQQQIGEAMQETTQWANRNAVLMNEKQLEEIRRESQMQIYTLTPEERAEWMRAWDPIYSQYESAIGPELIKQIRQLQRKYGG